MSSSPAHEEVLLPPPKLYDDTTSDTVSSFNTQHYNQQHWILLVTMAYTFPALLLYLLRRRYEPIKSAGAFPFFFAHLLVCLYATSLIITGLISSVPAVYPVILNCTLLSLSVDSFTMIAVVRQTGIMMKIKIVFKLLTTGTMACLSS